MSPGTKRVVLLEYVKKRHKTGPLEGSIEVTAASISLQFIQNEMPGVQGTEKCHLANQRHRAGCPRGPVKERKQNGFPRPRSRQRAGPLGFLTAKQKLRPTNDIDSILVIMGST